MNRRLLLVVGALALLVSACSGSSKPNGGASKSDLVGQNQVGTFQGAGLVPPQPRPNFVLTDTHGKPFSFGSTTSKHPTFLYFGYTNCPDVCPETMADIRIALSKVPAAVAKRAYVVFVTTDIKHDSASVIGEWLKNFARSSTAAWVGLRGTQAEVDAAQAAAHVTLAQDEGKTHSAQVLLYGADDYAHVTFLQSSTEQQQMIHDLPLVVRS